MRTKEFSGRPTNRQVIETLSGIKNATNLVKLSAEKEGLPIEEYEKIHGKRKIEPSDKRETENDPDPENERSLRLWVYNNIPKGLRNDKEVKEIFRRVSLEKMFQDTWNYKIAVPKGLTEKAFLSYLSQEIESLEDLSGIELSSKEITFLEDIFDEIGKIKREIKFLKSINEGPSKSIRDISKNAFSVNTSYYLRRKIIIEKLEEILTLINNYEPS